MLQWIALRLVAPVFVGAAVVAVTWGRPYFDIFGPLVWSLFVVHLVSTFSFKKTHVLDTGAFVVLIVVCSIVAGEQRSLLSPDTAAGIGIGYAIYLMLSFVGRRTADASPAPAKSVGLPQVMAAIVFLLGGILVCGSSKFAVGFLMVPGLIVVPVILLYHLVISRAK